MREVWVRVIPYNKDLVTASIESGADAVVTDPSDSVKIKELGLIKTVCEGGDIVPGRDAVFIDIASKSDEERAAVESRTKTAVVSAKDWKIIPLENLIASGGRIFAAVGTAAETELALGILEKGVAGLVIETDNVPELMNIMKIVRGREGKVKLSEIIIESVEPLTMGDRVCIDTCTNMREGEGMLIGNTSGGMFLVHSESIENPYVAPRPFRVNAGAVHSYILLPDNRTKYLSELRSGERVLIVGAGGETQPACIGRVKLEKRPMLLVKGISSDGQNEASVILQNAETIRLTGIDERPISVVKLSKGDRVLGWFSGSGRHFGMKVDEFIEEK